MIKFSKQMIKINANVIKGLSPCQDRLDNYLQHYADFEGDIIDFLKLESISMLDKLWVLCEINALDKREWIKIAIFAAKLVLHFYEEKFPDDARPRLAIQAAENYLKATGQQDNAAARAASDAAHAARAACDAAHAAARAASDAAHAARAACDAARAACAACDAARAATRAAAHAATRAARAAHAATRAARAACDACDAATYYDYAACACACASVASAHIVGLDSANEKILTYIIQILN